MKSAPVGSVRTIISIAPPSCTSASCSMQSSLTSNRPTNQHRRRGLPVAALNADASPSPVAVASYYRQKMRGKGDTDHSSDLERVNLIATCMDGVGVGVGGSSRSRTIALATVVDEPMTNGRQNYRVMGIRNATTNLLVSAICISHLESNSPPQTFDIDTKDNSILVAIDTFGMLHTCPINNFNSCNNAGNFHWDIRECHFENAHRTATYGKRVKPIQSSTHESKLSDTNSPDLRLMNSLTSREESDPIIRNKLSSSQITFSPAENLSIHNSPKKVSPKRNERKRKQSNITGESVKSCGRIFLVASNLNTCILPSQSPPIVMLLSSSSTDKANSPHFTGLAWSIISGLEQVHVPLSCILYVSRSRCGSQIWAGILSAMKKTTDAEIMESCFTRKVMDNEGLVLMGFQDGTMRASLVVAKETKSNFQLDAGHATNLFQLSSREPIKSIQILSPPPLATDNDTPLLICVGALGAIVSLSSPNQPNNLARLPTFRIHEPLELCGGCWQSISCVKCYFLDSSEDSRNSDDSIPPVGLAFIGVNDLKQTFLHQLAILNDEENVNSAHHIDGRRVFRLPIPSRLASSVLASPQFAESKSPTTHFTFSLASSRGSVNMMKISLSGLMSVDQTVSRNYGGGKLLASELIGPNHKQYNCAKEMNHKKKLSGLFNAHSLLLKLEAATVKEDKVKTWQLFDSVNRQSKHALHEIREISRAVALINNSSFRAISSPIELKVEKINKGVAKCCITSHNMPLSKQPTTEWITSVHILQSCIHALSSFLRPVSLEKMPPICFRRRWRRDEKLIPVVYGGTATSYNSCHSKEEINGRLSHVLDIDVSMNDFIPVHVYGSMSMVYANSVPNSAKDDHDFTWAKSEVHVAIKGCTEYRASTHYPELANSGIAKNANASRRGKHGCAEFLGVSLPFNLDKQYPFIIDILSHFSTSNGEQTGELDETVRGNAEQLVIARHQNRSNQKSSLHEYVVPWLKERKFIMFHSAPTVDKYASAKFYCSSSFIHFRRTGRDHYSPIFSDVNELCVNAGCSGTINMAITHTHKNSESVTTTDNAVGVVEIAVGSNVLNPDECVSILPLVRQAIIRHGFRHHDRLQPSMNSKDITHLLEFYRKQLNEKRAAKVTKHVQKVSDELIANIIKIPELTCPTELLTKTVSLYETLRAMDVAFLIS